MMQKAHGVFVAVLVVCILAAPYSQASVTATTLFSLGEGSSSFYLGYSVATSGNIIAVGAPGAIGGSMGSEGEPNGLVVLYDCTFTGCPTNATYVAPSSGGSNGEDQLAAAYGFSVALTSNGTVMVVGAPCYGDY